MTKRKKSPSQRGFTSSLGLTFLAGSMVFMSFPNFLETELFFLQWFSLVPLLFALEGRGPRKAFFWSLWCGFVVNAGGFYWITHLLLDFGHMPLWIAAPVCGLNALYQGLVFGFWGAGTAYLRQRCGISLMVCAPILFAIVENLFPLVFPWYFANGQYLFYPVVQMVEWTGIPGLTWLLVLVNCGLFLGVQSMFTRQKFPVLAVCLPLGLLVMSIAYGMIRIGQVDDMMENAPSLKIGMVEANVGIFEKEAKGFGAKEAAQMLAFNLVKHQRLSAQLEKEGLDLLVWPESSYIPRWAAKVKTSLVDAVAIGDKGNIYLQQEGEWRAPSVPVPREVFGKALNGLWAGGEEWVYGVGENGLIVFFDGDRWDQLKTSTRADFYGVTGFKSPSGKAVVWIVGEGGVALIRDGDGALREGNLGSGETLRAIDATSQGRLAIAVGDKGTILEINRRGWERAKAPTQATLSAVWVEEDRGAWAAGEDGLFRRSSSGKWSRVNDSPRGLTALWGDGLGKLYVGGESGLIARYEQGSWHTEVSGGRGKVTGIGGSSRGTALAVRTDGKLLQREESGWKPVEVPGNAPLRGVVGLPYRAEVFLPHDVEAFYKSSAPLPEGDTAAEVALAERGVPNVDKMSPQRGFSLPVLFGILLFEDGDTGDPKPFNSTVLLDEGGQVLGRYDKNHLLVFGEYIPGGEWFPQIYEWVPQANHFYAGTDVAAMPFKGFKLGPLVCYEDILPSFTRKVAEKGVHAFINMTNDAWFGKTAEPYLHLALATFRSVENRKMMVRSTNTGVSAFIDAAGRIAAQTSLDGVETLVRDVPMLEEETFYTRYGNVFLAGCYGVLSLCLLYGFWPGRGTKRPRPVRKKS